MVIAAGSSTILAEGDSVVGVSGYHASVKASDYATVVNMNCPNIDLRDNALPLASWHAEALQPEKIVI